MQLNAISHRVSRFMQPELSSYRAPAFDSLSLSLQSNRQSSSVLADEIASNGERSCQLPRRKRTPRVISGNTRPFSLSTALTRSRYLALSARIPQGFHLKVRILRG